MGTANTGHGFTSTIHKWIFLLLILFFAYGLQLVDCMSCYAAAQLVCYKNLTKLIVLMEEKKTTPDEKFNICRAFYDVQNCFVPHLTQCEQKERELFMEDVVSYLSEPPYKCQNQSIEVFMEQEHLHGSSQHLQGLQTLYLSLSLFLLHYVIHLVFKNQLR